MLLEKLTYESDRPGKRLLVLGSVHGNETCGTYGIRRVLKELEEGTLRLERGSVTFVPICNPKAFAANTREVDHNLNRFLGSLKFPDHYETKIGLELCPLLEACDILLDLHSYHSGNGSYTYVGVIGSTEHAFANSLGADVAITGWTTAYANSGRVREKPADPEEPIGTTEYARRFGAIAATIECGQHQATEAPEIAYRAIWNALKYCEIIIQDTPFLVKTTPATLIALQKVIFRGDKGMGRFTKDWKELDRARKDEIIAYDDNDQPLRVPQDCFVILPNPNAKAMAEWFYWGVESSFREGPNLLHSQHSSAQ